MKDIAEACGVSRMTVSLALRGRSERMTKETYERILKTAEKLGYKRDPRISQLTSYLTEQRRGSNIQGELAYLMPLNAGFENMGRNDYFYDIIQESANYHGYNVNVYEWVPGTNKGYTVEQLERIWDSRGIRGVFVGPMITKETLKLNWDKYSWVAFGESLREPELHKIDSDFRQATTECCKRLHSLGYKRIGLCVPIGYDKPMQFAIRTGYDAFFYANSDASRLEVMYENPPEETEARFQVYSKWIKEQKPDAIIAEPRMLDELVDAEYKIPKDFAFASWLVEGSEVKRISGMARADATLAKTSVELLVSQINHGVRGIPADPIRTRITGHWVGGKTSR